jgi:hypothetical protein
MPGSIDIDRTASSPHTAHSKRVLFEMPKKAATGAVVSSSTIPCIIKWLLPYEKQ